MGERREVMTNIVSLATGVPEDRLEEFKVLRELLDAADNPGAEEERYDFGLVTFCWPFEGELKLVLSDRWNSVRNELAEIERDYWPYHARPINTFALFSLTEENLAKARR